MSKGFHINIATVEEYTKYLGQNAKNLSEQVSALKKDTLKAEEEWKDSIYSKTLENITEMEKIFKNFDEDIRKMTTTLRTLGDKYNTYVD